MQLLDEILYFCKMEYPSGALLLTGEWGSGKTHFILHDLGENQLFKDSYNLIYVSLFGVITVTDLHERVRNRWFHTVILKDVPQQLAVLDKVGRVIKNAAEKASGVTKAGSIAKGVLSINATDLFDVERTNKNKKSILVFDDLERCRIETSDLLGAINTYSENEGINTIIIANEEKISNHSTADIQEGDVTDHLTYSEIKEKVIFQTVHYEPVFDIVVSNIIDTYIASTTNAEGLANDYKNFLREEKVSIINMLQGNDENGSSLQETAYEKISEQPDDRQSIGDISKEEKFALAEDHPQNIRSLKAGLQQFERVYIVLKQMDAPHIDKWFLSFMALNFSVRGGNIRKNSDYDYFTLEEKLKIQYPGYFDIRYFSNAFSMWLIDGAWNDEMLDGSISSAIRREKAKEPWEQVLYSSVEWLDEKVVQNGFPKVLEKVYDAELSLDDYALFIQNCRELRTIEFPEIELPDWNRVYKVIHKKIQEITENYPDFQPDYMPFYRNEGYSEEEWKCCELLNSVQSGLYFTYASSRKQFLEAMKKKSSLDMIKAFTRCASYSYDSFDAEMAESFFKVYQQAPNSLKGRLGNLLIKTLQHIEPYKNGGTSDDNGAQIQFTVIKASIDELISKLETLKKTYETEERVFAKRYTEELIVKLQKYESEHS